MWDSSDVRHIIGFPLKLTAHNVASMGDNLAFGVELRPEGDKGWITWHVFPVFRLHPDDFCPA